MCNNCAKKLKMLISLVYGLFACTDSLNPFYLVFLVLLRYHAIQDAYVWFDVQPMPITICTCGLSPCEHCAALTTVFFTMTPRLL